MCTERMLIGIIAIQLKVEILIVVYPCDIVFDAFAERGISEK